MFADEIYTKTQTLIKSSASNDPFTIASDNNIMIRISTEFKELKGLYTIIKERRIIILNGNLPYEERKMVCAHELGHDMLHREYAVNKVLHEYILCDRTAKIEYEANMFAADMLITDDEILDLARGYQYTVSQIAHFLNINPELVNIKISNMNLRGFNLNPQYNFNKNVFYK